MSPDVNALRSGVRRCDANYSLIPYKRADSRNSEMFGYFLSYKIYISKMGDFIA